MVPVAASSSKPYPHASQYSQRSATACSMICFSIAGSAAEGPVFPEVGHCLLHDLLLVGQLAAMFCASPRRPFSAWNREFSLLGSAAGRVRGFGESLVFAEMLDHVVLRCPDPDESVTIAECDGGFAFECGICCFVHAVHNFSVSLRQFQVVNGVWVGEVGWRVSLRENPRRSG